MPKFSVIIPFRDRHDHLQVLVPYLRKLATRQQLDLEIIVSEQIDDQPLRRGALRNEGARVASGDILVLHDVDYVPDDTVTYWTDQCKDVYRAVRRVEFVTMDFSPRPENDTPAGYRTFKDGIDANFFGGVLCITKMAFQRINGYNPMFQGWGLEDDDFRERIRRTGLNVVSSDTNTFFALPHPDSYKNDELFKRNQQLFIERTQHASIGLSSSTAEITKNRSKAVNFGVDQWLEVTDWNITMPKPTIMVSKPDVKLPRLSEVDYGIFLLLDNVDYDHVQKTIALGNRWEPDVMALCEKYVTPGSTVVDIGANMGTFTVRLAQLVGTTGKVVAFEPQRFIYQQLCGNLFVNRLHNVETYNCAIGDRQGVVTMTPIDYTRGAPGEVRINNSGGEQVPTTPLDLFELQNVSLIKMDVERYEPFVFVGAEQTIRKNRPVILFELTTLPLPDFPPNFVLDTLKALNYNVYLINGQGDYLAMPAERDDNK
jgi:FkbM family methyltransferase